MCISTYALLGRKLGHSYSAEMFNSKFRRENIPARYVMLERENLGGLRDFIASKPGLRGFNVTIPYKEEIIPLLDAVSDEAREAGAVNVVKVDRNPYGSIRLSGFNSDIYGFREAIRPLIPDGSDRTLVLGNGGAARAVVVGLRQLGLIPVIVARNPEKAREKFPDRKIISFSDLDATEVKGAQVVVNTTPLGMWPNVDSSPDIPYEALDPSHLCFDLVYNPEVTLFMRRAVEHGARTACGLEMLRLQAVKAWEIWQSSGR